MGLWVGLVVRSAAPDATRSETACAHALASHLCELAGIDRIHVFHTERLRGAAFDDHAKLTLEEIPAGRHGIGRNTIGRAWLQARAQRLGLDVLHESEPLLPFLGNWVVARVVTVHNLAPLLLPALHAWRRVANQRLLLRRNVLAADRVIAPSETTRQDLVDVLGVPSELVRCVPHGARDDGAAPVPGANPWKDRRPFALAVGPLDPSRNLPLLLRAFAGARKQGVDLGLVLAGPKGPRSSGVIRAVRRHGLQADVVLQHPRDGAALAGLIRAAHCVVVPAWYAGFGVSALDALATGTPVLASNSGAVLEVVGDSALVLDPRDEEGWVWALCLLATDAGIRDLLSCRGRDRARQYSWGRSAQATFEAYREAVQNHAQGDPNAPRPTVPVGATVAPQWTREH